ncbi:MAG TPA: hypothetical protein VIV40_11940 [Kofleriaceae bacterium]
MRTVWLVLILVAACKDKQEAKPAPAPTPPPVAKQEPTPPPAEPTTPTAPGPAAPAAIKPAGGITSAADYEAKAFDLTDKLTAVFASAGTNCDKLADSLEVFVDENQAALASTSAFQAANPTVEDELEPKLQQRAQTLITKMRASMQACQKHARVTAALAKLPK